MGWRANKYASLYWFQIGKSSKLKLTYPHLLLTPHSSLLTALSLILYLSSCFFLSPPFCRFSFICLQIMAFHERLTKGLHVVCALCVALWCRVMVLKGYSAFCFPWNNDYSVCGLEPRAAIVNRATMMGHGQLSSCINTLSPLSLHSGRRLWCGRVETDVLKAMHASNAAFGECSLSPSLSLSIHSRLKRMRCNRTQVHITGTIAHN